MSEEVKQQIFSLLTEYINLKQAEEESSPKKLKINYAGPVYDEKEVCMMVDAILQGWFALGSYARQFEEEFSKVSGVSRCIFTNSGSSANLLAVSALMSKNVGLVKKGDEVITPAVTYPTTINPLIQNGLRLVLVDIELGTYTIKVEELEKALSERTKLVMLPHLLGSPNDMDVIMDLVEENDLLVVEDCCDALGSTYRGKQVGGVGALGTFSFYAAHQITTGEGGCVVTDDEELGETVRSIRDAGKMSSDPKHTPSPPWGRLPTDYDRRYVYTNIGYSLRPVEFQAAMGIEQLKKLPQLIKRREENFKRIYDELRIYEDYFILPKVVPRGKASWYAFPLTVRREAPFKREDIVSWLEKNFIETRPFFAGNIIRQPAYTDLDYRAPRDLKNSDMIMRNTFFIGVYPALTGKKIQYMMDKFHEFIRNI